METIKIFLASSIVEFKNERYELAAFTNSLNNICVRKEIYLEMNICEELSNAVAMGRKQNEYNQFIRDSDYVFMLFGKDAGKYTIEEYDVALEQFRKIGAPKIYVYFKQSTEDKGIGENMSDFMKRLDRELPYCYSCFSHLDTVKMDFLKILSADERIKGNLECYGGQVLWYGQQVLSSENLPGQTI